jgi:hypothetical protein
LENNPVIDKDVYLFLVKYNGTKEPLVAKNERFVGYAWFDVEDVTKIKTLFDI